MSEKDKDKDKDKDKGVVQNTNCPQPLMPDEFFAEYPGATWDSEGCFWRDRTGNPIGGG